ncbi:MAG TPA: ATP-binding protein, partial [Candidatus Baltobacteraceae bacterium]|nr:ATP-binding protein [Candidatus Baltobacteraceae bacterium]
VVLGAESTGTTTLARALAERYGTVWAPEYGRHYAEGKYASPDRVWRTDEFVHIAETQHASVERLARSADRVVFSDTDALATAIWHERYVGSRAPAVEAFAAAHRPDLYLLTGDEIPFEQDGLRDGEHLRHWMHGRFEEVLAAQPVPYLVLRGGREERVREAVRAVDGVLMGSKNG